MTRGPAGAGVADLLFPRLLTELREATAAARAAALTSEQLTASVEALRARTQSALGELQEEQKKELNELRDGLAATLRELHGATREALFELKSSFQASAQEALREVAAAVARIEVDYARREEHAQQQRGALADGVNRVSAALAALDQKVDGSLAAAQHNIVDLIGGFGRLDETMVAFGARLDASIASGAGGGAIAERLDTFDRNMVGGIDLAVRTIWEANAALSAELKDMPQQLTDAGVGGGGMGHTDDGVPAGDLVFPRAARADVEPVDMAKDMLAYGKDNAAIASKTTKAIVAKLNGVDFSPMARNSPELKGIDWAPYLEYSTIRVARTLSALKRHVAKEARILDFGAYFGNFSLGLAAAGYATEAVDAYEGPFGGALAPFAKLMRDAGVKIIDVAQVGYDFHGLPPDSYDAVLFMSAIEHVPHTPRTALEAINRVLKPGGILVIDTPNLGYAYTRRKFLSGKTVFPPIEFQFETDIPFFGHHREFLPQEVLWMLGRVGHEVLETEMFNYSLYGMSELRGEHLALWRLMQEHPQLRELIFTVSRKR